MSVHPQRTHSAIVLLSTLYFTTATTKDEKWRESSFQSYIWNPHPSSYFPLIFVAPPPSFLCSSVHCPLLQRRRPTVNGIWWKEGGRWRRRRERNKPSKTSNVWNVSSWLGGRSRGGRKRLGLGSFYCTGGGLRTFHLNRNKRSKRRWSNLFCNFARPSSLSRPVSLCSFARETSRCPWL